MTYDVIVKDGLWFDGTGRTPQLRNLGIRDGVVATVSAAGGASAVAPLGMLRQAPSPSAAVNRAVNSRVWAAVGSPSLTVITAATRAALLISGP